MMRMSPPTQAAARRASSRRRPAPVRPGPAAAPGPSRSGSSREPWISTRGTAPSWAETVSTAPALAFTAAPRARRSARLAWPVVGGEGNVAFHQPDGDGPGLGVHAERGGGLLEERARTHGRCDGCDRRDAVVEAVQQGHELVGGGTEPAHGIIGGGRQLAERAVGQQLAVAEDGARRRAQFVGQHGHPAPVGGPPFHPGVQLPDLAAPRRGDAAAPA
jgi:hypothetical protein